jgi:hypothetical protein
MVSEQEPIKIEIPVEEEPVVMLPERQRAATGERLAAGMERMTARARAAWESEKREQAQEQLEAGLRRGARSSQTGVARGLRWLSRQLACLAERFTPAEKPPEA